MISKALERPNYLTKPQEIKVWEVQVEEVKDGDHNCYFHYFTCPRKAEAFSRQNNVWFYVNDFFYSSLEEMRKRRGVKHF